MGPSADSAGLGRVEGGLEDKAKLDLRVARWQFNIKFVLQRSTKK